MQKKLVLVCLINFLIAALMGLALRYSFINPIGVNYRFLTHAHSHVAMLGWVYLMLYVFIVHYFFTHFNTRFNGHCLIASTHYHDSWLVKANSEF